MIALVFPEKSEKLNRMSDCLISKKIFTFSSCLPKYFTYLAQLSILKPQTFVLMVFNIVVWGKCLVTKSALFLIYFYHRKTSYKKDMKFRLAKTVLDCS